MRVTGRSGERRATGCLPLTRGEPPHTRLPRLAAAMARHARRDRGGPNTCRGGDRRLQVLLVEGEALVPAIDGLLGAVGGGAVPAEEGVAGAVVTVELVGLAEALEHLLRPVDPVGRGGAGGVAAGAEPR